MEQHGIELAEQPAAELEDLAMVRSQTAVPISADESVASRYRGEAAALAWERTVAFLTDALA